MSGTEQAKAAWWAPVAAWWAGLALRERRLLAVAAAVVGVALLWALALQPAWRTLAAAPAEHDRLDAQLQAMQREAVEAQALRSLPPLPQDQAATALRAATERLGDKAKLVLQADRAVVTFNGVAGSALRDWLAEARAGARARPVEANLQRSPQGFAGTMTLAFGAGT